MNYIDAAPQLDALAPGLWRVSGALYREAEYDELPGRFGDPVLDLFRTACTNGFVGGVSIASAFLHKPPLWPQCFPQGADGDCSCRPLLLRRVEGASDGR